MSSSDSFRNKETGPLSQLYRLIACLNVLRNTDGLIRKCWLLTSSMRFTSISGFFSIFRYPKRENLDYFDQLGRNIFENVFVIE